MNKNLRHAYVVRDGIMNLLSDDEVVRVSMAETAERLAEGEEYINLEQIERGVLRATGARLPMGRVLPRNAVHLDTWTKILMRLTGPSTGEVGNNDCAPTPRNT
jgi:hypothetical protein